MGRVLNWRASSWLEQKSSQGRSPRVLKGCSSLCLPPFATQSKTKGCFMNGCQGNFVSKCVLATAIHVEKEHGAWTKRGEAL